MQIHVHCRPKHHLREFTGVGTTRTAHARSGLGLVRYELRFHIFFSGKELWKL